MNPKLLFALVIVIVLLAAAALIFGATAGPSGALDFKFGGLDQIAAGLAPEMKLKASDIGSATPAGCLDLLKIGQPGDGGWAILRLFCQILRRSLARVGGGSYEGFWLAVEARLAVAEDGSKMQVKDTIGQTESYQLQFLKQGGTVILWCEGGAGQNAS